MMLLCLYFPPIDRALHRLPLYVDGAVLMLGRPR